MRLALPQLIEHAGTPDVAIVDPPRAGLSAKVVRRVMEAAPKRIVYVSCNPTTLAPNMKQMVESGYELRRVRPVDMFPHTPHIERVAVLDLVDDEKRLAGLRRASKSVAPGTITSSGRRPRKREAEARAASGAVLGADLAAVGFDQSLRDRKAKARAAR